MRACQLMLVLVASVLATVTNAAADPAAPPAAAPPATAPPSAAPPATTPPQTTQPGPYIGTWPPPSGTWLLGPPQAQAAYVPTEGSGRVDPLLPAGISMVTFGTIGTLIGALSFDTYETETCGLNGCITMESGSSSLPAGAFLASGLTLMAVGLPTMISGAWGSAPRVGERPGEARLTLGLWLAGYGAGTAAYGIAYAVGGASNDHLSGSGTAGPFVGVGSTMAAVGLGLALSTLGEEADPTEGPQELASAPAMYTGMAMTSVGVVSLAAGSFIFVSMLDHGGQFAGFGALVIGVPVLTVSSVMLGVGIPLWATGAQQKPADGVAHVSFRVGAGMGTLEGSF